MHEHEEQGRSNPTSKGTVYIHCECGAVRVIRYGVTDEGWHACSLCSTEVTS